VLQGQDDHGLEAGPSIAVAHDTEAEPRVGVAKQSLRGRNHYVQDVVLSLDGKYLLFFGKSVLWWISAHACVFNSGMILTHSAPSLTHTSIIRTSA
jgi:hypothetical protein